jgi:23S rRNA (cytosine1962-C5)-methyltransferase
MKTFLVPDYELLDSGNGRRLERFGKTLIDRPAPQTTWHKNETLTDWNVAHAYYDRPFGESAYWKSNSDFPTQWNIQIDQIKIELRPEKTSQVGVHMEQLPNWQWMTEKIQQANRPLNILNVFAFTGVETLIASATGKEVSVCHVDESKANIAWARHNTEISGLTNRPIRWINENVLKFMAREVTRGKKYDGIILTPPTFGRNQYGEWKLERDLPHLLDLTEQLLSENPCFVILNSRSSWFASPDLAHMLSTLKPFKGSKAEAIDLIIPSQKGNELPMGICGRIEI